RSSAHLYAYPPDLSHWRKGVEESGRRCGIALKKQVLFCLEDAGESSNHRLHNRVRGWSSRRMIRFFRFALLVLLLCVVALLSAVATMHFAIHGAEVSIPDFRGLTVADAMRKAASLDLNLSVDNRFYSAEMPEGRVLTQAPASGTVVRRE